MGIFHFCSATKLNFVLRHFSCHNVANDQVTAETQCQICHSRELHQRNFRNLQYALYAFLRISNIPISFWLIIIPQGKKVHSSSWQATKFESRSVDCWTIAREILRIWEHLGVQHAYGYTCFCYSYTKIFDQKYSNNALTTSQTYVSVIFELWIIMIFHLWYWNISKLVLWMCTVTLVAVKREYLSLDTPENVGEHLLVYSS